MAVIESRKDVSIVAFSWENAELPVMSKMCKMSVRKLFYLGKKAVQVFNCQVKIIYFHRGWRWVRNPINCLSVIPWAHSSCPVGLALPQLQGRTVALQFPELSDLPGPSQSEKRAAAKSNKIILGDSVVTVSLKRGMLRAQGELVAVLGLWGLQGMGLAAGTKGHSYSPKWHKNGPTKWHKNSPKWHSHSPTKWHKVTQPWPHKWHNHGPAGPRKPQGCPSLGAASAPGAASGGEWVWKAAILFLRRKTEEKAVRCWFSAPLTTAAGRFP